MRSVANDWLEKNGHEISYEGVSILEVEGDKISRFFAYFDPRKLGKQIEETEGTTNG